VRLSLVTPIKARRLHIQRVSYAFHSCAVCVSSREIWICSGKHLLVLQVRLSSCLVHVVILCVL
jgi:hypothetical protein